MVTTAIGSNDVGYSIAIQTDGKIVVAGTSLIGSNNVISLVRYNSDGSLDNTFDTDGIVTTSIGTSNCKAFSLTLQSDGRIIVAGTSYIGSNYMIAVVRYNPNGTLDNTFDTDGIVTTAIGSINDIGYSVAVQNDGKIVVAGRSNNGSNNDFALVRYNPNGSLDNSFDFDGMVTTAIDTLGEDGSAVAIQSDGKIVVGGDSRIGNNNDFAAVRYNVNGSLDNTFDIDGIVTTSVSTSNDFVYALGIQSDGKIILAGSSGNGSNTDFALVRYNVDGSLDNTFDFDGKVITSIGSPYFNNKAKALSIQSDGKIIAVGYASDSTNGDFVLVRYNTDGSLDSSFNGDGIVITSFGASNSFGQSSMIQNDGKIVVAGFYHDIPSNNNDFAVARYNNTIDVGIAAIEPQKNEINVYPNPFADQASIVSNNFFDCVSLSINSIFGEKVRQINNLSGNTIIIDRENLPSGLYILELKEGNHLISRKKLMITLAMAKKGRHNFLSFTIVEKVIYFYLSYDVNRYSPFFAKPKTVGGHPFLRLT